jgi:hypothetical protein
MLLERALDREFLPTPALFENELFPVSVAGMHPVSHGRSVRDPHGFVDELLRAAVLAAPDELPSAPPAHDVVSNRPGQAAEEGLLRTGWIVFDSISNVTSMERVNLKVVMESHIRRGILASVESGTDMARIAMSLSARESACRW